MAGELERGYGKLPIISILYRNKPLACGECLRRALVLHFPGSDYHADYYSQRKQNCDH